MSSNPINMWSITTSWETGDRDGGGDPKLKGARWFSFAEIKNITNNISDNNGIEIGGYCK